MEARVAPPPPVEVAASGRTRRVAMAVAVAVAVVWLAAPWIAADRQPVDAAAFVAAAQVPAGAVYADGETGANTTAFNRAACASYPDSSRCREAARFVSSPGTLVLLRPLRDLDGSTAVLVVRIAGAVLMVGALAAMWRRGAASPNGPLVVATTAVALTPAVFGIVAIGQNVGLHAALAALAVDDRQRRPSARFEVVVGVLIALAAMLKGLPILLVGLLLLGRRLLAAAAAVAVSALLSTLAVAAYGTSIVTAWLDALRVHTESVVSSAWNSSPASFGLPRAVLAALLVLGLVGAAGLAHRGDPVRAWAVANVVLIVFSPQFWSHYLVICVGALAAVRPGRWSVPVVAALTSWVVWRTVWDLDGSRPLIAAALVLGLLVLALVLAPTGPARREPAGGPPTPG